MGAMSDDVRVASIVIKGQLVLKDIPLVVECDPMTEAQMQEQRLYMLAVEVEGTPYWYGHANIEGLGWGPWLIPRLP